MITLDRGITIINNIMAEMDKADIEIPIKNIVENTTRYDEVAEAINYLTTLISNAVEGQLTPDEYLNVFKLEVGMSDDEITELMEVCSFHMPKFKLEGE